MKRLRVDETLTKSSSVKTLCLEDEPFYEPTTPTNHQGSNTSPCHFDLIVTPSSRPSLLKYPAFYKHPTSPENLNHRTLTRGGLLQKSPHFYKRFYKGNNVPVALIERDINVDFSESSTLDDSWHSWTSPVRPSRHSKRELAHREQDICAHRTTSLLPPTLVSVPTDLVPPPIEYECNKAFECRLLNSTAAAPGTIRVGDRVRFRVSPDDGTSIYTETRLCDIELSNDEVKKLWWTRREQKDMKRRARSDATWVLACIKDFRLAVEQLLLQSYHDSSGATLHSVSSCGSSPSAVHDVDSRFGPFTYDDAVRIVVNHGARGKEQAMINSFRLNSCRFYYKCDQVCVAKVLETQSTAKSSLESRLNGDSAASELALKIAMEHGQYSVFAARFARMLGEGDAKAALGVYDEHEPNESVDSDVWGASLDSNDFIYW
jgi:hypothetical protein